MPMEKKARSKWPEIIEEIMLVRGWTLTTLAQEVGATVGYMSSLRSGRQTNPGGRIVEQLMALRGNAIGKSKDERIVELEQENAQLKKLCDQIIRVIRATQSLLPDVDFVERELTKGRKP